LSVGEYLLVALIILPHYNDLLRHKSSILTRPIHAPCSSYYKREGNGFACNIINFTAIMDRNEFRLQHKPYQERKKERKK